MPNSVLATRFNNLQNRIRTVLGTSLSSNPQFGYGQTFSSTSVTGDYDTNFSSADLISAEEYAALYEDIVRARVHQIGFPAFSADMQALPEGDFENNSNADKIEETYISYLENLVTSIENNKFEIDSTQYAVENLLDVNSAAINITRQESVAGSWNGTISHVFKITFPTAAARRHFFNAGGQIRTRASISWPFSQNKTNDWKNLLSNMGAVCFGATSTFRTGTLGTGTGSNIGNYDLTSSYQLVFRQTGSLYTGSFYELYALNLSDTEIQFRVYFRDTSSENIDENVFGDLTSLVEVARPDGEVSYGGSNITTVEIGTPPVGQNITVFAGVVLPTPPTVSASWGPAVTEGQSQTLTWSSTNSTSVSYVITDPNGTQLFNSTGQSTNGSKTVTWQSAGTGTAVVTAIGAGGAATTTATTSVAQQVLVKSYNISPSTPSTQNEGTSKTFTVSTVNVPAGTLLYWQAISTSGSLTGSDFTSGVLQGSISVQSNGNATLVMTLQNDTTTDPNESYQIEIHETNQRLNPVVTSGLVTINDTSKSPITYTIQGVSNYPSDPNLISEKLYTTTFTVTAYRDGLPLTNSDGDGNFYWTTRGTGITSADFTDGTTVGRVTVTNGIGTIVRDAAEDLTTEGSENFIIDLRLTSYSSAVVASSNSITISDDSKTRTPIPPTINTFQFTATSYVRGDTATLEWTTSLADSVTYTITQPNGSIIGPTTVNNVNGNVSFTLPSSGTGFLNASLTASNTDGTDTASAPSVSVSNPPAQPTGNINWSVGDFYQTSSLPASQVRTSYPDSAVVSFSGNDFTDLRVQILEPDGSVALQQDYTSAGSVSFSSATSGSPGALARLYGKNADYTNWQLLDSAYKVVINEPSPVTINSFNWVPSSATVGDNVSVNWTTSNATSVLLEYGSTSVNVNTNGSRTDSFSTAGTKSAVLTATNVMTAAVAQANISISGASPLELVAQFDNTFGVGDNIQAMWIVNGNPGDISSGSIQLTQPNGTVVDSTSQISSGYYFDLLIGTAVEPGTYSITGSVTHRNGTVYNLVGQPVTQDTAITQVTLVPSISPSAVTQNQNYTVSLTTDPVLANTAFTTTEFGTLYPSGTTWSGSGRQFNFTTDSQGNWSLTGVHTGDIDYYFTVDFPTTSTNQWVITNNGAASNTLQVRTPSASISWGASSYTENDTISASWTSSSTSGTVTGVISKSGSGVVATKTGTSGTVSLSSAGEGTYTAWVTDSNGTIISNTPSSTVAATIQPPPKPNISISPSSGAINSDSFTLSWDARANVTDRKSVV